MIDDHEMEKSYQTGDLFLEFLSVVSWIASIKVIVLKLYVMKIVHGAYSKICVKKILRLKVEEDCHNI